MSTDPQIHKQFLHLSISIALALAGIGITNIARAQDGYYGPAGDAESASECAPSCRPGYACVDGACTSPCNPPCAGGEVCSRNGQCIPAASVAQPRPRPAPAPTSGWATSASPTHTAPVFDQALYDSYKRKKEGGGAAMAVGVLFVCAAIGMGVASGVTGNEVLLYVGIGVEIVGNLFFFPGLAAWVKGKRGMDRMGKSMARHGPERTGPRLMGVTPLLAHNDAGSGGGLALNFAF